MMLFALSSRWACSVGNPVSIWSATNRNTSASVRKAGARFVGGVGIAADVTGLDELGTLGVLGAFGALGARWSWGVVGWVLPEIGVDMKTSFGSLLMSKIGNLAP